MQDKDERAAWGLATFVGLAAWYGGANPFLWALLTLIAVAAGVAWADTHTKSGGPPSMLAM